MICNTSVTSLVEQNLVTERIDDGKAAVAPGRGFQRRAIVLVGSGGDFPVERFHVLGVDKHLAAWCAVAGMFAQVKNQVVPGDLQVDRRVGLEAVLPIELHTQEIEVKLLGPGFVEDTDDRDCLEIHTARFMDYVAYHQPPGQADWSRTSVRCIGRKLALGFP